MSSEHAKRAEKFTADTERMHWHDQALFIVREKRDQRAHEVPEWEALREAASRIKLHTLTHWAEYLDRFEKNAQANGIRVHWAADADEHNRIVYDLLQSRQAKNLIKSKSMLTEECGLAPYLEARGIEVTESDLGERIMQLMHEPPSHIVLPAIHVKREEVGKVFEKYLHTEKGNSDPTYLTRAARQNLRQAFLQADAALTGVNFGVAETGAFVVCTNEGNADMGTSFPKLHIASMGIEKLVPDYRSLAVFIRLLARSATGQTATTYTSHYKNPIAGHEIHLILVDNGRSDYLGNESHFQSLKCIRCGACMNTCPVYRRSGGYSYTYFIPGPIGINLGMLRSPKKYHDNVSACSLCYSCSQVCPVKIDLAEQIYRWRQQLDSLHLADPQKKFLTKGMDLVMDYEAIFNLALKVAPIVNRLPRFLVYNGLNDWGKGREMPVFATETFQAAWKKGDIDRPAQRSGPAEPAAKTVSGKQQTDRSGSAGSRDNASGAAQTDAGSAPGFRPEASAGNRNASRKQTDTPDPTPERHATGRTPEEAGRQPQTEDARDPSKNDGVTGTRTAGSSAAGQTNQPPRTSSGPNNRPEPKR